MTRLNVFFDHNTSPRMASALHGYIHHDGHKAIHLRDKYRTDVSDVEWISELGNSSLNWIVITGDKRIRKNRAEREAFRQSNLLGLVLSRGWQKTPMEQRAALLIWRWPHIENLARTMGSDLFELPLKRTTKFTPLPL